MTRFEFTDLPLSGLKLVRRRTMGDDRGFLERVFCDEELRAAGWLQNISQINHTYTARRGTVRGMHYQQPPYSEMKLVTCIRGAVMDVAVDIRAGSGSFLDWYGETLSAENSCAMLIPEGFAHGFQTLTDDVELLYCHTAPYCAASEAALNPIDRRLGIDWPLDIADMSVRDRTHPAVDREFGGISL